MNTAAVAIELYLKCLSAKKLHVPTGDVSACVTVHAAPVLAGRKGHELPALFDEVPDEVRDNLERALRKFKSATVRTVGDRKRGADEPRAREGHVVIESRILGHVGRVALCVLAISLVITPGLAADDSKEAWAALVKGGQVAVIRHGNAPPGYGGDPPGFKVDDCKTQRNLDELGREQARALGEAFRSHGVRVDRILSSPWCRCLETARLMAVGPVEASWALVPDTAPRGGVRLLELKEIVSAWRGPGTLVLVTHAFTVRALMGFLPIQGEIVVLKPGSGTVGADLVGRIAAPQ